MKTLPSKKNRIRVNITFDPVIYQMFRLACGLVPPSRQIEELVKQWLQSKEQVKK